MNTTGVKLLRHPDVTYNYCIFAAFNLNNGKWKQVSTVLPP